MRAAFSNYRPFSHEPEARLGGMATGKDLIFVGNIASMELRVAHRGVGGRGPREAKHRLEDTTYGDR